MFDNGNLNKSEYIARMQELKNKNQESKRIEMSKRYITTGILNELKKEKFPLGVLKKFFERINSLIRGKFVRFKYSKKIGEKEVVLKENYFSNKKFIVYTSVFGDYDIPQEPLVIPDNCEYIFVGTIELPNDTIWKKYDLQLIEDAIAKLDDAGKNRYCKMFPHILFPECDISIYVDGNIKIITDLTEMINVERPYGLAFHYHQLRNCVYNEAKACTLLKKADKTTIHKYIIRLKKEKFPSNYGLLECNVIVRDHDNSEMQEIMALWWKEYSSFVKRDQLSLPYILWKMKVEICHVALLGENVATNSALKIVAHK